MLLPFSFATFTVDTCKDFSFYSLAKTHAQLFKNELNMVVAIRIVQLRVSFQLHFAQPDVDPFSLFPKK